MGATKTKIDGSTVRSVLTADGWMEVRDFQAQPSGVTVGGVALGDKVSFAIRDGTKRVLPATAVLDVRTVDLEAEAQARAQRAAESEAKGEAVFTFVHYSDRETFNRQVEEQGGVCASCRSGLAGMAHAHMDPDGLVRCPACSVLKVRYGNQMPDALNRKG